MTEYTRIQKIVAFIAGAIMADGTFDDAEVNAIQSIANSLNINEQDLLDDVNTEIEKQDEMSDEELEAYLIEIEGELDNEEMMELFQVCLVVILADGVLCKEETAILLAFAEILKIDPVYATLMIAYMVNKDPEIIVEIDI